MPRTFSHKLLNISNIAYFRPENDITGYLTFPRIIQLDKILQHSAFGIVLAEKIFRSVKKPAVSVHYHRRTGFAVITCNCNSVGIGELFRNDVLTVCRSADCAYPVPQLCGKLKIKPFSRFVHLSGHAFNGAFRAVSDIIRRLGDYL